LLGGAQALHFSADVGLGVGARGPHRRVLEIQAKLHRWAAADAGRGFDDLFYLEHGPATLLIAFERVAGNTGGEHPRRGSPDGRPRLGAHRCAGFWTISALR